MENSIKTQLKTGQGYILNELCQTVGKDVMEEIVNNYSKHYTCHGSSKTPIHQPAISWSPEESILSHDMRELYTGEFYSNVPNVPLPCSSPEGMYWSNCHFSKIQDSPYNIQCMSKNVNQESFSEALAWDYTTTALNQYLGENQNSSSKVTKQSSGKAGTNDFQNTPHWVTVPPSRIAQFDNNMAKVPGNKPKPQSIKKTSQSTSSSRPLATTGSTYVMTQRDGLMTLLTPTNHDLSPNNRDKLSPCNDSFNDSGLGSDCSSSPYNSSDQLQIQSHRLHLNATHVSPLIFPSPDNKPTTKHVVRPKKRPAKDNDSDQLYTKRRRHNEPLNDNATTIMLKWYEEHKKDPYPSKADKEVMAKSGNISVSQVNSWFANKRNRNNNTRPKVQKRKMEEKLINICQQLSTDSKRPPEMNSVIIQQLSSLLNQAQSDAC